MLNWSSAAGPYAGQPSRAAHPRRARRRLLSVLLAAASVLAALIAAGGGSGTSAVASPAVVLAPGASLAHPYSDPVWWPFSTEIIPDCYRGNPGCTDPIYHTGWLMDPGSPRRDVVGPTAHEPVYAMGAGIAHYGVTSDQGCGGQHGRGNWLWIDHGNGTLSWYGHLYWPFKVSDGEYVTARTQIGEIGNSGYSNCLAYPSLHYTDIAVKTGATNGLANGVYTEFRHLYACVDGQRQTWPDQLPNNPGTWRRWNDVPRSTRANPVIIPASDPTRSCISATPQTPNTPSGVRLRTSGSGSLTVSWYRPVAGTVRSILVTMRQYHPSIKRWLDDGTPHVLSATATSFKFTGLYHRHLFRATVSFRNAVGLSAGRPSAIVTAP